MRVILFFIFNMLLVFGIWYAEAVDVTIPDANLEAALRHELNKPTGPLTDSDLASLVAFRPGLRDISDLTGLEYCTNLVELIIWGNQVSNISSLANLTNLTWLLLYDNQISDISALANLTNLTWLSLHSNQITDISPLANLTNLPRLNLHGNQITDINALANLTNLVALDLPNNQISDISALEDLINLKWLDLQNNQISDISALANPINLMGLRLWNNQISNISALANLTSLSGLNLWNNQISDISALANLTNLKDLVLGDNQISDTTALVNNTGLGEGDHVDLRGNPLSSETYASHIPILLARGVFVEFDIGEVQPVTDLSASTGTSGKTIVLNWTAPSIGVDIGTSGTHIISTASAYIVRYNTAPIAESNWHESYDLDGEPTPGPAGRAENMTAMVPYPGVIYYFAIRTQDELSRLSEISNSPYARSPMQLYVGWNLGAFMSSDAMPVEDAMSQIDGKYAAIWTYNASESNWLRYIVAGPDFLNNLDEMWPGYGYWIKAKEDCVWDFGESGIMSSPLLKMRKPPFMLYGEIYESTSPRGHGELRRPALNVSLRVGNVEAGNYVLGSNPHYEDYYVLEIPVDGSFREGDVARMYVDGALTEGDPMNLGGIGVVERHDISYQHLPEITRLLQNYPNPFNPETWIPFQLSEGGEVEISIYGSAGQLIKTMNLGFRNEGYYTSQENSVRWNGLTDYGEKAASGVYFYTIRSSGYTATRKMMLVK